MKILLISHEFPPEGGGAGIVAKQYCDYLAAMGHNVTIVSANIDGNNQWNNKICKVIPKNYKFLWPIFYNQELKKLSLNEYDRIILNDIGATLVAGIFFNESQLKKTIIVLHGQEPEQIYTQASHLYRLLGLKKYYHRSVIKSKSIIAVSKYMKEKFLTLAFSETEKVQISNKINVLYTAVNERLFNMRDPKQKATESKIKLITVSRIEREKGFDDCIKLAIMLKSSNINFEWTIIGDGSYLNSLKSMIKQNELTNHIKLLGRLSQETIATYYKSADLFLLFSHMTESFGLVYLEAQLCGCPAIGFNKFGVRESIFDQETGFLVKNIEDAYFIIINKKYKKIKISPLHFNIFSLEHASKGLDKIIRE